MSKVTDAGLPSVLGHDEQSWAMTPAPSAGGEEIKKKRKRKRSRSKSSKRSHSNSSDNKSPNQGLNKRHKRTPYAKRVDEVSAGGLVINKSRTQGLLKFEVEVHQSARLVASGFITRKFVERVSFMARVAAETRNRPFSFLFI